MKKSSIVKKLFIVNFIVFISFIIFSLLIQQIFFEKFYIHKKKKEAEKIITSFAKVYSDTGDLKEAFTKSIEVEEVLGHRFIILDNNGDLKYIINPVNDKFAKGDTIAISDILLKIKTDGLILYLQQDKYLTHVYFNRRFPSNNIVSIYNYKNFEYIVLISSLQPINEASNVIGEFYLYFLLAGVVATIVLSFIYSKTVSKPILEIKEVADRMANLDFSRVIDIKTDDELGMLATAINTMSRNLKNALESLREANKKLEEDIEKEKRLEKMRRDFVAATSHELKTPISLIQGYLEAFKDDIFSKEDKNYYIDILLDETNKMNNLVNDMLDLSHLESGKYNLQIEEFNLSQLTKRVINKFNSSLNEKNIQVELDLNDIVVKADFNRLEQVISNFLTNAIRHTSGKIKINLFDEIDYVKMEVINSGEKIPQDEIENIWDKFYKVDKSGNKKFGGTGLGLSIVKNIVQLHGGNVGVNNLEDGVCFYFTIPKFQ